ncbi:yqkD [Symbiodinium natans]|uniref:YqkD protein n=1 Tax=Symbiodinium natans TaxID=878477 RepID=A0A812QV64_9DINO|nr:yqkD [Symbiodinium natans]
MEADFLFQADFDCEPEGLPVSPSKTTPVHPGKEKTQALGSLVRQCEPEEPPEEEKPEKHFGDFSMQLFEAWRLIIRPPRRRYPTKSLGPTSLQVILPGYNESRRLSQPLERHDIELLNKQGLRLRCSHFRPSACHGRVPCVIFCHGSSSCRVDAFQVMPWLFEYGLTVFAFDFAGSGQSDGEYVTLGYHEEDDLRVVIDYLVSTGQVSSIGLWGKSMGAVASLLRTARDRRVDACVLDSPFADFLSVVHDYCNETSALQWVPGTLVDFFLARVSQAVEERVGLDPRRMQPIEVAPQCHCPAFFIAGDSDRVVRPQQVRSLHQAWGGESQFVLFTGGHNTDRPPAVLEQAARFMWDSLQHAAAADALVCGAVDAFLDKPRLSEFGMSLPGQEEDMLAAAIEQYVEQRQCLDRAIDHFLLGGGAPPSTTPAWRHLTQSHIVQAMPVTSKMGKPAVSGDGDSELFSVCGGADVGELQLPFPTAEGVKDKKRKKDKKEKKSSRKTEMADPWSADSGPGPVAAEEPEEGQKIEALKAMGFEEARIRQVLDAVGGSVEKAVPVLLADEPSA